MYTSAEDSLQQTERMVSRQCKWNSLSEANDQSITSTWVVKKKYLVHLLPQTTVLYWRLNKRSTNKNSFY